MKKSELRKIIKEEITNVLREADPSLAPPKKWFNTMHTKIKKSMPKYSEDKINATIGDIWYNKLDNSKRAEIRKREGKKYGPAKENIIRESRDIKKVLDDILKLNLQGYSYQAQQIIKKYKDKIIKNPKILDRIYKYENLPFDYAENKRFLDLWDELFNLQ